MRLLVRTVAFAAVALAFALGACSDDYTSGDPGDASVPSDASPDVAPGADGGGGDTGAPGDECHGIHGPDL